MSSVWGLLALTCACLWGCDLINPEEPVPAYIQVEPFQVSADSRTQGSASAKITEAWLQVNGEFLGAYKLPARIPVLAAGSAQVVLNAGIKDNGILSTPEIYPFYQPYNATLNLKPNEVTAILPRTTYQANTRFPLIEGFENSGHLFQSLITGSEFNRIQIRADSAFEGTGSGLIQLTAQSPSVELATTARYRGLLDKGAYVYLEVNYQSDVPVGFGVIAYTSGNGQIQYAAGFNPNPGWNKIYFNLSPTIAGSKADEYQIILKAAIPVKADGTLSQNSGRVRLDNIKLLHF